MTPEDGLARNRSGEHPKYPVNVDELKVEEALKPARGCLWGIMIAVGIYALAAFVVALLVVLL